MRSRCAAGSIARLLVERGARGVVVTGRHAERGEKVRAELDVKGAGFVNTPETQAKIDQEVRRVQAEHKVTLDALEAALLAASLASEQPTTTVAAAARTPTPAAIRLIMLLSTVGNLANTWVESTSRRQLSGLSEERRLHSSIRPESGVGH